MPRNCRRCGRDRMRLSPPKNTAESLVFLILRRPFRCTHCNAREMRLAWWWERTASSRPARAGKEAAASSATGFTPTPVEDVRSAIREREEELRKRASGSGA